MWSYLVIWIDERFEPFHKIREWIPFIEKCELVLYGLPYSLYPDVVLASSDSIIADLYPVSLKSLYELLTLVLSFPTVWGEDGSMRLMRDHDGSCETSSDYRSSWRIGTDDDSLWGWTLVQCSSRGLIARCLGWSDDHCQPTNTQLLNSLPDSFLLFGVIYFVG